ncbi:MAG TPA: ester cyclase [Anaerolineales bacterium]|nr:ester cyclase [Anaerolineales bacterium]
MNKRETVQALMDAVQQGDFENVKSMLADDFQFSGNVPEPINAETWLGMSTSLKIAFPDLDYHFKVIGADGDVVKSTAQLSGTHNGSFDLTSMNLGMIPATKKEFSTKSEKTKVTVKENKITLWAVEPNDGAGLMEILNQLDARLPKV